MHRLFDRSSNREGYKAGKAGAVGMRGAVDRAVRVDWAIRVGVLLAAALGVGEREHSGRELLPTGREVKAEYAFSVLDPSGLEAPLFACTACLLQWTVRLR